MNGTVGITDHGWYEFLLAQSGLDVMRGWQMIDRWANRLSAVERLGIRPLRDSIQYAIVQ